MNAKAVICPSEQELADYGLGKLDNAASETIDRHLETCADCRTVVDRAPGDSFVVRLREANAQPPVVDSPGAPARTGGTFAASESFPAHGSETRPPAGLQSGPMASGLFGPSGAPPELVDHPEYELRKELGHGGMGVVYLAHNRMMDRPEVLKVVSKSLLQRPGAMERFQQEIRSAAKLAHPNIVAAYSVLRPGDLLVFCMEYVEGQDLSQIVKQRGPLPVTNATFYAQQVALGLQHAFEKGMVHRDIKPNNLMVAIVNKKHVVKILDFGLAKATSEKGDETGLTKSGQILGTPDYIAPEQTLEARQADIRADIYSLGCTLYCLLSGKPPFSGGSLFEVLQAHHKIEAQPLDQVRPDVPAELAAIVAKMMAKDPAHRYQKPLEVAKALNPFFKAPAHPAGKPEALLPPLASIAAEPPAASGQPPSAPRPVPIVQPVPVSASPLLILSEHESHRSPSSPRKKRQAVRRHVGVPIAVGLLLLVLAGLAAVIFKFHTSDGVVALEVNEPNPEVFVDGNRVSVAWEGGGTKAELTLPAGSRRIELKKDGFQVANSSSTSAASKLAATEPSGAQTSDGFVPLFNGKDLTGWNIDGVNGASAGWSVQDGSLLAVGETFKTRNYLLSDRDYSDFILRAEFKLDRESSGAVALRAVPGERLPAEKQVYFDHPIFKLVEATNRKTEETGTTHWLGDRMNIAPLEPPLSTPAGVWHRLEMELRGNALRATVNGTLVVDLTSEPTARLRDGALPGLNRTAGRVGLQRHTGTIRYRNVEIKELPIARVVVDKPAQAAAVAATATGAPAPAVAPFDAKQARAHQDAWAKHLGTPVETTNSIGMKLVLIPPGEFMMGSTPEQVAQCEKLVEDGTVRVDPSIRKQLKSDGPQHRVTLTKPFRLAMTEVTVGQFKQFVDATSYVSEAEKHGQDANIWRGPKRYPVTDDSPVTCVTWNDAVTFCNWLSERDGAKPCYRIEADGGWTVLSSGDGYRLPTEAEWEYACRAGTTTQYSFGDDASQLPLHAWFKVNARGAQPVRQKRPNPFELYDMHGNAWEWCQDRYADNYYEVTPRADPLGPTNGSWRVMRGGVWDNSFLLARSAYRKNLPPTTNRATVGFRVAGPVTKPNSSGDLAAPAKSGDGFVSLFNGKDLTGWVGATEGYVVERGKLVCLGSHYNLFTVNEYADFDLRFEFLLTAGANNGLALRSPLQGLASNDGIEVQILDESSPRFADRKPWQNHGSIYGVVPAKLGALKPAGQWNVQEVVCQGSHVVVILNGIKIVDAELDKVSPLDGKPHPGLNRPRGYLGFLGLDGRVEFRNIAIKELSATSAVVEKRGPVPVVPSPEPDPIGEQLAKAKAAYEDNARALAESVLKILDRRESSARTAGEKQVIDLITLQREAFEKRGEIPTAVSTIDYQRQLFAARARLETAYEAAVRGFTKAKLDSKAEEATRDLNAFRQSVPTPVAEFAGKRYKVLPLRLSWRHAQAKCAEMGGHLPIITTAAENQFLAALTKSQGYEATWLGATDEKVEGKWLWVNGNSLAYANWERGQPNNFRSREHYAALVLSKGNRWVDYANDPPAKPGILGFICQWD